MSTYIFVFGADGMIKFIRCLAHAWQIEAFSKVQPPLTITDWGTASRQRWKQLRIWSKSTWI